MIAAEAVGSDVGHERDLDGRERHAVRKTAGSDPRRDRKAGGYELAAVVEGVRLDLRHLRRDDIGGATRRAALLIS